MSTKTQIIGSVLVGFGLLCVGCEVETLQISARTRGPVPGKPVEEHRVTVRARPEIQAKDGYSLLLLPAVKGRSIEVICDESFSPWFKALPKDRPLLFSVWQTKRVNWHTADGREEVSWESQIETIKDGDAVIHDAAVCPLHKTRMNRTDIEISYGLPVREFLEAYEEFAGGPGFTLGGCVISDDSPRTARGYKCDECVAAYERWGQNFKATLAERKL